MHKRNGFTLLEILLVVAAIAILAGIVILALNPTKQLGDTRNAQRRSDVNTILSAVYQYAVDHNGSVPGTIPTDTEGDCPANDSGVNSGICIDGGTCTNLVNLHATLVGTSATYIVDIPTDPSGASGSDTRYDIVKDANSRVTVCAPSAEQSASITVTR